MIYSVFTGDLSHCIITGSPDVHLHHIYPGTRRKQSERYGFVVPLRYDLHEFGKDSVHENPNTGLDLQLKQKAQRYFEENIGDRDEFREIFGKSWL